MATKHLSLRNTQLCAVLLLALASAASAESVIYKGSLQDAGKPANGTFDLRVQLYSSAVGGDPVSAAITLTAVQVENGQFNVPLELAQPLPKQGSVWLQAQLKAPGASAFQQLEGRQEISSTLGGICWETTGNALAGVNGILGITDNSTSILTLRNDTSSIYLRRNGGVEQGFSSATGSSASAWGNASIAAATNSFATGFGNVVAGHTFSTVFADNSVAGTFPSTAANQFLVRAAGGFAINTNVPLGTLTVRRGGSAGVAVASASTITTESDASNYVSLLAPATLERGILFGDPASSANGGILFNPVAPGFTNPNGLTFRTGGNQDRLKITSSGQLLLNQQNDPPNADVSLRSATGGNTDFFMNLRSNNGNLGTLRVAEVGASFTVQAETGDLLLNTNTSGKYIRTNDRLGVRRSPAANELEVEGNASKTTATAWLANSDRRIKQDIQPLNHALQTLRKVQPVSFHYTEAYRAAHPSIVDQRYFNVIAQDFAQVFPDAVKSSGEYLPGARKTQANEILQVDTYPATITAIAAIQELDAANTLQDREFAALKEENAELRQRLDAVEQLLRAQR
jgi:hypothetical protein